MNKKNLYRALGATFTVAVSVVVFVASTAVYGQYAPRTPSGEIINLGQAIFNDYEDLTQFALERGFVVTFAKGGKHNPKSLHPKGKAIDIRTRDHTPEEVEEFMLEAKAAGLRVVDERCKPKKKKVVWNAPHLHLEISQLPGTNQKGKCKASRPTPEVKQPTPEEPASTPTPAPLPAPAPTPPPAPEQTPVSGSVTSTTCQVVQLNAGIGGTVDYYDAVIKGTASGPVNSYLNGGVVTCDSWHDCNRGENDPPTTNWTDTQRVYVSRDELADPAYNGAITNEISIGPPRPTTIILPNHTKVCPQ